MAWFAAQLKAAEGLLEAVDKTVSKTVGTLGLAEGESELSTEHGYLQAGAGGAQQAAPLTGNTPYGQWGGNIPTNPYAALPLHGPETSSGSTGALPTSRPSAVAAPIPWDSRTASVPVASGTGTNSATDGGGFTVKADAPIPFGSRPVQPPTTTPTLPVTTAYASNSVSRSGSQVALAGAASGGASASGAQLEARSDHGSGTAGAASVPAPLGPSPVSSASPVVPPQFPIVPSNGSSTTTVTERDSASGTPQKDIAAAVLADTPRPGVSGLTPGAAPASSADAEPSLSAGLGSTRGSGGIADVAAPSTGIQPQADVPSFSLGSGGQASAGAHQQHRQVGLAASGTVGSVAQGTTPVKGSSDRPILAADATPPEPGHGGQAADGAKEAVSATGVRGTTPRNGVSGVPPRGLANAAPADGPEATAQSIAASTAQRASPSPASTPAATSAAAATLAASATAAASSLASATTTAVTHSLSFFNLLDEPEDGSDGGEAAATGTLPAAAGGGEAAAAASASAAQVAALSRTCEQLRKRLEASRVENEQLEDMLARAEVKAQQEAALVASLRAELAAAAGARAAAEGSLAAQLAAAKAALDETSGKYEAAQRRLLLLEGQLAALEESSKRLMEAHSDREGDMLEALRGELAACEARLAAERKAAAASRAAAAAREADLEAQIAGSSAALADLTRGLEEANRKSRALEEEVLVATRDRNELAARAAALRERLAEAGLDGGAEAEQGPDGVLRSPAAAGHRGGAAAAAAAAEVERLRGEVEQQRRAAAAAQAAADASAAQAAALAAEVESLRQGMEAHKDTAALEAQLREASDMLYLKQTQLERLAAEKAAQQIKTERELDSARQELAKLSRQLLQQGGGAGGSSSSSGAPHDVIPMDALGEPYQRLTRHSRVGRAVKAAASLLDSTAATTSFALRQYPLARLAVFAYVLLIHMYVYMLIARMQRLATQHEAASAPRVA